jgi:hypothetical protein
MKNPDTGQDSEAGQTVTLDADKYIIVPKPPILAFFWLCVVSVLGYGLWEVTNGFRLGIVTTTTPDYVISSTGSGSGYRSVELTLEMKHAVYGATRMAAMAEGSPDLSEVVDIRVDNSLKQAIVAVQPQPFYWLVPFSYRAGWLSPSVWVSRIELVVPYEVLGYDELEYLRFWDGSLNPEWREQERRRLNIQ